MAERPVFFVCEARPYYKEELVQFLFNPGFAVLQKQKNIKSIHDGFKTRHRNARLLEISSKSEEPLGIQLSAFNLRIVVGGIETTVESAFQAGKVFQNGGPFSDLLSQPSYIAKKDPRLRESGNLIRFSMNGIIFPLEPKTFFYDWLYINAVWERQDLAERLCEYDAFTDIEFNPEKSINCQARSAAIFVSLCSCGEIKEALKSPQLFKEIVYSNVELVPMEQFSLFDS